MIFNTKAVSLVAALLVVSTASSWGQSTSTQGVSRQISALKTALENYSENMDVRMATVEGNVTTLRTEVDAFNNCAERGMIYSPARAPNSEGNCMSVSSAGVIEIIPDDEIIDTGRTYNVSYRSAGRHGGPRQLPADIFQVSNIETISSVILKTRTHTFEYRWETGREGNEDSHSASVTIGSYIRVGDAWVPIGAGGTVSMDRNTNLTSINGAIHQGLWTGEIANIPDLGRYNQWVDPSRGNLTPVRPEVTKTH